MKISNYSFLFEHESECFIYNSLSKSFLQIDKDSFDILISKKDTGDEVNKEDIDKELYDELKKRLMICQNHKDEFLVFKSILMDVRNSDKRISFTIAPTMDCCFNCFYCFEKGNHKKTYITDEVIDSLIKNIQNCKELEEVHITWFGGEPLLNFRRIESLTGKILGLGINYSANIVTNGYLLDENKISKFEDLHINSIQLTIDGLKKEHDRRRPHISGKSSFDRIMKNLDIFFSKNRNIRMNIRVNIDKNNEEQYYPLLIDLNK